MTMLPDGRAPTPIVKVYTTPGCPHCQAVKAFLAERRIPFEEIDVSVDPGALWHVVGVSGRARVPIVWARRQMVIGFDADRLEGLLASLTEPEESEPDLSGPIDRRGLGRGAGGGPKGTAGA